MTPDERIAELVSRIEALEAEVARIDKQSIRLVGTFDGTNAPVTVQGIRRKIATVAP